MKILHPDMNPEITEAQMKLFEHAVSAYENGDLPALRIINEMIGSSSELEYHEDTAAQLSGERNRLAALLKQVREEIEKIKSEYPYTMKEFLDDPAKLEHRRQELTDILEQYQELIAVYKAKIEEMLR